jgi:N utilization substance protein A
VEQELLDILDLQPENILKLAEYGIKTIEDLAEISSAEFKTLIPRSNMTDVEIESLIQLAKNQAQ